jgi:hypothetical protein
MDVHYCSSPLSTLSSGFPTIAGTKHALVFNRFILGMIKTKDFEIF